MPAYVIANKRIVVLELPDADAARTWWSSS